MLSDEAGLKQSIEKITDQFKKAEKPLIWLGVEIDRLSLQEKASKLVRRLNIPYVTELLSKAVLSEDDERFAGVFDGRASSPAVEQLVKGSDFILALGVWLTDINSLGWDPDFNKTAFVSLDTVKYGTYFGAQVSLEHLMDGLLAENVTCKPQDLPQKPADKAPIINLDDEITYQGFYDFIPQYIDGNTIVGSDASMNYFGSLLLLRWRPQEVLLHSHPILSIGYIAAAATGICLAKTTNQRVMVFSGDGGFQMSAQCLSTQTRFKLNPIVFVIDNGVYEVEQWLHDASVLHDTAKQF